MSIRRDLDAQYAESWTLGLDLKILAKTVVMVAQRRGVNPEVKGDASRSC